MIPAESTLLLTLQGLSCAALASRVRGDDRTVLPEILLALNSGIFTALAWSCPASPSLRAWTCATAVTCAVLMQCIFAARSLASRAEDWRYPELSLAAMGSLLAMHFYIFPPGLETVVSSSVVTVCLAGTVSAVKSLRMAGETERSTWSSQ